MKLAAVYLSIFSAIFMSCYAADDKVPGISLLCNGGPVAANCKSGLQTSAKESGSQFGELYATSFPNIFAVGYTGSCDKAAAALASVGCDSKCRIRQCGSIAVPKPKGK